MKKEEKLIVTFDTATQALAAERTLRKNGREGRLVPVPAEIQAGCGMSWMDEPDEKDNVTKELQDGKVKWREMIVQEV